MRYRKTIIAFIIGVILTASVSAYLVLSQRSERLSKFSSQRFDGKESVRSPQRQASVSTGPLPSTVADLPPLYPAVEWKATESAGFASYGPSGVPIALEKGFHIESVLLKTYPAEFMAYYRRELTARGWKVTGSGQGPSAFLYTYAKNDCNINFGFHIVTTAGLSPVVVGYRPWVDHNCRE